MPNGVEFEGRLAHVGTFPIGIEPNSFIEVNCAVTTVHICANFRFVSFQNLQKPSVIDRVKQLEQRFGGVKVIVGVDRLDYIKGVPQKLHALELFLSQHPEWIGKVRYILSQYDERHIKPCSGRSRTTRSTVTTRRGNVSEFAIDCERTCRAYQWTFRHGGVHAYSFHAQEPCVR